MAARTTRTRAKAKAAPAPEVDEDELEDLVEDTDADEDLEELEEDEVADEKPVSKKKKAAGSDVTFGIQHLRDLIKQETGDEVDARQLRTLIRKMARDESGRVNREIKAGNRSRYDWSGPNDPEVRAILEAYKDGELERDKQEKLQALKERKAAQSAAKKKAAEEVDEDDELEEEEPKPRRRAAKKAAPARRRKAKPAPVEEVEDDDELDLDED